MATNVQEIIRTIEQLSAAEREYVVRSVLKTLPSKGEVQSLASLKRQYPNEWLAIVIPDGEDAYDPRRGRLVAHNTDRSTVWEQMNLLSTSEDVFVFFNGPIAPKGFGLVFYDTDTPVTAASRA